MILSLAQVHQLQSLEQTLDESRMLAADVRHRVRLYASFQPSSRVHIHHLPPEIMSRIFELVQGGSLWPVTPAKLTFGWQPPKSRHARNAWMTVTAVCRQWNAIAREDPFLWNTLCIRETDHPQYYVNWIQRTGEVPLDILVDDFHFAQRVFGTEFPSWCARLRRLEIRGIELPERLALFDKPAPLLQSFTIIQPYFIDPLPRCLFSNHTPLLQHLFATRK